MRIFNPNEYGKRIEGFPRYEITTHGRVFNVNTGREMVLSPTMQGDLTVGLMRDDRQHRRLVKLLVAKAFVEGEDEIFDTPIQLDGDKRNLHANNIVWRPRWFAWNYTHQFNARRNWYVYGPIADMDTEEQWRNYIEAAIANGVLCQDIRRSIYSQNYRVFPTRQKFGYVA